jgi:hypothetical protein
VHAVLNPTRPVQHVYVQHSGGGANGGIPVHGATVTLTAPDGTVRIMSEVTSPNDPDRTGNFDARYDAAVGPLAVGQPYHLRVVMAGGEVAEGEAIVPATPQPMLLAERRLDPTRDTLRLAWPRASGARAYEVRIIQQLDSADVVYTPWGTPFRESGPYGFLAYVDTSVAIAGTARQRDAPVFLPGVRYVLIVSAVDDHYYEYFAHQSDPYTATRLPSSLRGAIGVFGAIVPILRQTIVVEGTLGGP